MFLSANKRGLNTQAIFQQWPHRIAAENLFGCHITHGFWLEHIRINLVSHYNINLSLDG